MTLILKTFKTIRETGRSAVFEADSSADPATFAISSQATDSKIKVSQMSNLPLKSALLHSSSPHRSTSLQNISLQNLSHKSIAEPTVEEVRSMPSIMDISEETLPEPTDANAEVDHVKSG